jgi:hypothetical protein
MFEALTRMTPQERANYTGYDDLICGIACKIKEQQKP